MFSSTDLENIQNFLRANVGDRTVVIGVSGGIDSAVAFAISAKTFRPERIRAIFMPESPDENDLRDVRSLSAKFGVPVETLDIGDLLHSFIKKFNPSDKVAIGNLKARIRMIILYYFANSLNGLVLGTTNRTEFMTGYFTKYGDGACDLEPIMHLFKSDVREAASFLGVPEPIISRPPSAGLYEGQTDEKELGISYDRLDYILNKSLFNGLNQEIPEEKRVIDLLESSKHKRAMPKSLLTGADR